MSNPLLSMEGLPSFSQIKPEHVKPAIEQAIADCKARIAEVLKQSEPQTWDSLVAPSKRWTIAWVASGHRCRT